MATELFSFGNEFRTKHFEIQVIEYPKKEGLSMYNFDQSIVNEYEEETSIYHLRCFLMTHQIASCH
jgi:hypothetical protein